MSDFYEGRMIPLKIADAAIISCNKEIEKLQIENAWLKAEVERLKNNCDYIDRELDREIDKTAMLCGQVERLRKAGDAVCESPYLWENDPAVIAWRAAKEGKPSV